VSWGCLLCPAGGQAETLEQAAAQAAWHEVDAHDSSFTPAVGVWLEHYRKQHGGMR
jgi:hypothetical protein